MPQPSSTGTPRTVLTFAGALGGFAVALYNYLVPLTGVTGTSGALLVVVACLALALAAVLIQLSRNTAWRGLLRFLVGLGAILTLVAAYFLHEWWLMVAMVLVLLGLILDIAQTRRTTTEVPA